MLPVAAAQEAAWVPEMRVPETVAVQAVVAVAQAVAAVVRAVAEVAAAVAAVYPA